MFKLFCLSLGIIIAQLGQDSLSFTLYFIILWLFFSLLTLDYIYSQAPIKLKLHHYIICLLLFAGGYGYSKYRLQSHNDFLIKVPLNHFKLRGYLDSPPETLTTFIQAKFHITSGRYKGKEILLNYPQNIILPLGYELVVEAKIRPLKFAKNPDGFAYQNYIVSQNIIARAMITQQPTDLWKTYAPKAIINQVRTLVINYLENNLNGKEYKGLLIALVTGYQHFIPDYQWQIFKNSGIIHIISISALNCYLLGIMLFLIGRLCNLLPIEVIPKRVLLAWFGVILSLLYSVLTGFEVATQRAFYFTLIVSYFLTIRYYYPLQNKLMLTLCLILLLNPFAVASSGFWFTFILVATIFIIDHCYYKQSTAIKSWLILQYALFLVGLPLSLLFYKSVSWVSIFSNLWAIPILANIITPIAIIATLLHLDYLIQILADSLNYLMIPLNYLAMIKPHQEPAPNFAVVLMSFIGILMLILPIPIKFRLITGTFLFSTLFMIRPPSLPEFHEARLKVFFHQNLGISLLQTKRHNLLIINNENESNLEFSLSKVISAYLIQNQIASIDYLITNEYLAPRIISDLTNSNILILNKITTNKNIEVDGLELKSDIKGKKLGVAINSVKTTTYIGNGHFPFQKQHWDNLIIMYPINNLDWVWENPATNLILNYPLKKRPFYEALLENLELPVKYSYDLSSSGSITIENNQVLADAWAAGENHLVE